MLCLSRPAPVAASGVLVLLLIAPEPGQRNLSPGPQPQVSCKKLKVRHVAAGDRTQLKRLKFCEHTTDRSLHTLYLPAGPAHEMKESG